MELNIIENALDSLSEAICYYESGKKYGDSGRYKFCILLLSHSAELLLKQVLYEQHEAFIYENIDDIKIGSKEPYTIGFRLALKRVKNICGLNMGMYYSYLEKLAEVRNEIQHYKFSISEEKCLSIVTPAFSAIEYIMHDILGRKFDDFSQVITFEQIEILRKDKKAFERRKADISKEIKQNGIKRVSFEYRNEKYIYIPCPKCSERYLVNKDGSIICKLCNQNFESHEKLFEEDYDCIISSEMKREIGKRSTIFNEIYECERCQNDTLVHFVKNLKLAHDVEIEENWTCLSCNNTLDNIMCCDCGDDMPNSSYNFTHIQWYDNSDDYKYLCGKCGKAFKENNDSSYYDIVE